MTSSVQTRPKPNASSAREMEPAFSPERTALLIIDPVNDFLSEGGAAWDLTKGTVEKNDVVPNLQRLLAGAREREIPVLFGPMAYTEEDYADERWQLRSGINRVMFERRMFLAGSWGADFHPHLRPLAEETILQPHKGTDVFETDLPQHLQRLGTTQLVIAGMTANLCCESTGRHATEHGYDVTFVWDAIGAESLPAYEASIRVNYPLIANAVMSVDEFLDAIGVGADTTTVVQPGDTVRGSDHGDIGSVERVESGGEGGGFFVVPRGIVFQTDTFIPLDTVVKRSGTTVFINVPKLVVGYMPWSEPPTATAQEAKRGPRRQQVQQLCGSRSPTGDPAT